MAKQKIIKMQLKINLRIKYNVIIAIFFVLPLFADAQGHDLETNNPLAWSPWVVTNNVEYQNVFRFGESEAETDLLIIISANQICAQFRNYEWDNAEQVWLSNYINLNHVKIDKNTLLSDQIEGEFVITKNRSGETKGLKITSIKDETLSIDLNEIGQIKGSIDAYFSGKYTQASEKILTNNELENLSQEELKIMRNEIFARYGYKFKSGGTMEQYFKIQEWYIGQHSDVDKFLTEIEKENIKRLLSLENK